MRRTDFNPVSDPGIAAAGRRARGITGGLLRLGLGLLVAAGAAKANDPAAPDAGANGANRLTYDALKNDASKGRELKKGIDLMKKYLKADREVLEDRKGASLSKVEEARADWRGWLDTTAESLGVDLRSHPSVVVGIIHEARSGLLRTAVKLKKGTIDSGSKPAPGYSRGDIVYNVLVPKSYGHNTATPYPLVVTLHGRAINLKHPALRKYVEERSRIVLHNNWGGDEKDEQQDAIVVAPTGRPDGFEFVEGSTFLRQTMFLGAGVGCSDYVVDSNAIFMEVYGNAVRDAIEMSPFFAGIIVRDREDAKAPPLEGAEMTLVQNLNGRPFYYVADDAKWDTVGKPFAEALEKAYKESGKEANLIIERVKRDASHALRNDTQKMATFLKHRLPDAQRELTWRFWRPSMIGPMPLLLTRASYDYDGSPEAEKLPLGEKCGLIKMKASLSQTPEGKPMNLIDLEIYEAEGAQIYLYEPFVDFDLPITVKVNGEVVVDNKKIRRDWGVFEAVCMPRLIFTFPVVATLDLDFPFKPRIAPPPPKEETKAPDEKTGDKPEEQPAEKPAEKAPENAPEKAPEKVPEKAAEEKPASQPKESADGDVEGQDAGSRESRDQAATDPSPR